MIAEGVSILFIAIGLVFSLVAAVGIVRMPDLFTRMQASAKAGTLGVGCMIIAVATYYGDADIVTRALMIVLFLFLTAPIGAHVIARAGYRAGVPLWERSVCDEMKEHVRQETSDESKPDEGSSTSE